jgi:mRNA interferase RelE/StbE
VSYAIQIMPSALRALARLPKSRQERIRDRIDALAENPRPPGVVKMAGQEGLYRIREGDYRVIFAIRDEALLVLVVRVGHRKEVYRGR